MFSWNKRHGMDRALFVWGGVEGLESGRFCLLASFHLCAVLGEGMEVYLGSSGGCSIE